MVYIPEQSDSECGDSVLVDMESVEQYRKSSSKNVPVMNNVCIALNLMYVVITCFR